MSFKESIILIVRLVGGAPWGFRLQGGTGKPLTVSKIRRKSRAHFQLEEGDVILSINGVQCDREMSHDRAMDIVDRATEALDLQINRRSTSTTTKEVAPSTGDKENIEPSKREEEKRITRNELEMKREEKKIEQQNLQILEPIPQRYENEFQKRTTETQESKMSASSTASFEQHFRTTSEHQTTEHRTDIEPTKSSDHQLIAGAPQMIGPSPFNLFKMSENNFSSPMGAFDRSFPPQEIEKTVEISSSRNDFRESRSEKETILGDDNSRTDIYQKEEIILKQSGEQPPLLHQQSQQHATPFANFGGGGGGGGEAALFKVTKFETQRASTRESAATWRPTSPIFKQISQLDQQDRAHFIEKPFPSPFPVTGKATVAPPPPPPPPPPATDKEEEKASSHFEQLPFGGQSELKGAGAGLTKSGFGAPGLSLFGQAGLSHALFGQPRLGASEAAGQHSLIGQNKMGLGEPIFDNGLISSRVNENRSLESSSRTIDNRQSTSIISSSSSSIFSKQLQQQFLSSSTSSTATGPITTDSAASDNISGVYEPLPETDMGSESLLFRRRKTFSSSSFYEEPGCIYPTVEEQVELCRKIADSLSADTNLKSKGANMFYKRVKRSHKWIHEASDPYASDGGVGGGGGYVSESEYDPLTSDSSKLSKSPYIKVSKGPPKLKLILDPREILDMQKLRSSGQIVNEHNAVSPDICMDLVRDLNSPSGRGAALFAKRKQKAEGWVVDEEKVKAKTKIAQQMAADSREFSNSNQTMSDKLSSYQNPRLKLVKSPWEAALESPIGSCDGAFLEVSPVFGSNYVTQSIIRAAENKLCRSTSPPRGIQSGTQWEPAQHYPTVAPPHGGDFYKPKAPRGWVANPANFVAQPMIGGQPENAFPPQLSAIGPAATLPFVETGGDDHHHLLAGGGGGSNFLSRPSSFRDFNSIPRSWSKKKNEPSQIAFKAVQAPRFAH